MEKGHEQNGMKLSKESDVGKPEQNSFATSSCVHDRIKKQSSFQSLALNFSEGLHYTLNS